MIKHHLQGKRVSWTTLEKIKLGRSVEYIRKLHYGMVKDVSSCGGMVLVVDDNNMNHEIETPEVEEI